eukprot:CAMPEP_0197824468 /NCGR_PEP_ID=MMETSP1437-20131217/1698_1 /TAXON_ID=49252 ORGANISM="Eucampia antarctica, Strain CCMP1452" /NCGR_SAMPLE_ID=MMETSP1437 /ASSEMBLY_ACC=CAM_ASM_001096 /LENGTH=170 /DNA_ID=CAMNT_0043424093 /DNA_START=68 /DNA_END=580 /DNA_ORIENTATION=+
MGNRPSASKKTAVVQAPQTEASGSGIVLSEELQTEIVQDFQNKVLKEEWEKRQKSILVASNQRIAMDEKRREDLENKLEAWRKGDDNIQKNLDEQIDGLKARFADAEVEIIFDVSKMEKKIGSAPEFGDGSACLDLRAILTDCYNKEKDIRLCDIHVQAVEACTKRVISS